MASMKPVLDKHNIRLVGVGLGYNSLDGFVASKVWDGVELYVDPEKKLYKALGLGQGGVRMLFSGDVAKANEKAKARKVGGNWDGDGLQLGGTYCVAQQGKVLMEYQQRKFGDHPSREDVMTALGLQDEIPNLPQMDV